METEVLLLPEMQAAGLEAMIEAEKKGLEKCDAVIAVYLAMRAVEMMALINGEGEAIH